MKKVIYKCDCCGEETEDKYKAGIREFNFVSEYIPNYGVVYNRFSRKHKIHLCEDCFFSIKRLIKEDKCLGDQKQSVQKTQ